MSIIVESRETIEWICDETSYYFLTSTKWSYDPLFQRGKVTAENRVIDTPLLHLITRGVLNVQAHMCVLYSTLYDGAPTE